MLNVEYNQHLKGCLQNYFIFHRTEDLVIIFNELIAYSSAVLKEMPKVNLVDMFKESYELDDLDLRLAFKEFSEYTSVDSVENMLFVICMIYKGFGKDSNDFKKEWEEVLDKMRGK